MDHEYAWDMAYCSQESQDLGHKVKRTKKPKPIPKKKPVVYWQLGNGKSIDIDTMTEAHLKNTLKYLVTNNLLKPK